MESEMKKTKSLVGIPSGFTALDNLTLGWQKPELIIVAGRPSMGKSAFCTCIARNAAIDHSKSVAIFSLEMTKLALVNRLISAEAEIESNKLKTGRLTDQEWAQLVEKTARITEAPIFIDDTDNLSITDLQNKSRKLKQENDIQLIIVDCIQSMLSSEDTVYIIGSLKQLARELDIPIIAVSQLNKSEESIKEQKAILSDLMDSIQIEQSADLMLFMYRPEYYGLTKNAKGELITDRCGIIMTKHGEGASGSVWLKFIAKYTKFENLENVFYENSKINNLPPVPPTEEPPF